MANRSTSIIDVSFLKVWPGLTSCRCTRLRLKAHVRVFTLHCACFSSFCLFAVLFMVMQWRGMGLLLVWGGLAERQLWPQLLWRARQDMPFPQSLRGLFAHPGLPVCFSVSRKGKVYAKQGLALTVKWRERERERERERVNDSRRKTNAHVRYGRSIENRGFRFWTEVVVQGFTGFVSGEAFQLKMQSPASIIRLCCMAHGQSLNAK